VTHEQAVIDLAGGLVLLPGIQARFGAGQVGAVAEHGQAERQAVAAWREAEVVDVQRQVRHLHRLAAGDRLAPYLRRSRARRQEVDGVARGRPFRVAAAGRVLAQALRRGLGGAQVDHPQLGIAAVLFHVRAAHGIDHARGVRRHGRAAYPFHIDQVFHGKAARRGHCGGGGQQGRRHRQQAKCHSILVDQCRGRVPQASRQFTTMSSSMKLTSSPSLV